MAGGRARHSRLARGGGNSVAFAMPFTVLTTTHHRAACPLPFGNAQLSDFGSSSARAGGSGTPP